MTVPRRIDADALTFDGDGTLWDFEAAMWLALEKTATMLAKRGLKRKDGAVDAVWLAAVRADVATRPELATASMETVRLAAFQEAIRRCDGDDGLAEPAFDLYMHARFDELRLYPDVEPVLAVLSRSFRLALVTNGNTYPHRLGLERYFDVVVVAFEVQLFKPDPAIYAHASTELDVPAGRCVHIGDDPEQDTAAAAAAGFRTIWLDRHEQALDVACDARVTSLAEIASLLHPRPARPQANGS